MESSFITSVPGHSHFLHFYTNAFYKSIIDSEREYDHHSLHTNPRHPEEETKLTYSHITPRRQSKEISSICLDKHFVLGIKLSIFSYSQF